MSLDRSGIGEVKEIININLFLISDDYLYCKDFQEDLYVYYGELKGYLVKILSYIREV